MKTHLIGIASIALMLADPAFAATDGQPGATSTGSFNVTLTVSPPVGDTVQIIGLDDFALNAVVGPNGLVNSGGGFGLNAFDYVCFNKSAPGAVTVTVDQPEIASGIAQFDNEPTIFTNRLTNGSHDVGVFIRIIHNGVVQPSSGSIFTLNAANNPAVCNANTANGIDASGLEVGILNVTTNPPVAAGSYAKTFTLTLAAQ
jgi:hypothetical protein